MNTDRAAVLLSLIIIGAAFVYFGAHIVVWALR